MNLENAALHNLVRKMIGNAPMTVSEMQLDARTAVAYWVANDLGRLAATGLLIAEANPKNFAFNGERFLLTDWGLPIKVEVKASALVPWLSDMRTAWGESFVGFAAGFVQAIRAVTATSHPELGRELVNIIGDKLAPGEAAWPLREKFAAALERIHIRTEQSGLVVDLSPAQESASDADENAALSQLAKVLDTDPLNFGTQSLPLCCDFDVVSGVMRQLTGSPEQNRQLWLLVFLLTHLGNKACDGGHIPTGTALLQAAHIALQRGVTSPEYFESALACCIQCESKRVKTPPARCSMNEAFSSLGYSNSRAVTCIQMFQASRKYVQSGHAKSAMWTAIWHAINRLRGCEAAFVTWAANDPMTYAKAAPVLHVMVRTHASALMAFVESLQWATSKSMRLPWLIASYNLIPKLQREFEWCRSIAEIDPTSSSFQTVLQSRFSAVPSFGIARPGISEISFLPAAR